MKPLEKLAREICWMGFHPPRTVARLGHTKASYWKSLPDDSKAVYEINARDFVYVLRGLSDDALNEAHCIEL